MSVMAPSLTIMDGGYSRGTVKLPVHCLPALAHVAILTEYRPLRVELEEAEGLWQVYDDEREKRYTIGDSTGALLAIEYRVGDEWEPVSRGALRDAILRRPPGPTPHLTDVRSVEGPLKDTWSWHCTCGAGAEDPRWTWEQAEARAEGHRKAYQ